MTSVEKTPGNWAVQVNDLENLAGGANQASLPLINEDSQRVVIAQGRCWKLRMKSPYLIETFLEVTCFATLTGVKAANIWKWKTQALLDGSTDLLLGALTARLIDNSKLPRELKRKLLNAYKRHYYKFFIVTTQLYLNLQDLGLSPSLANQLTFTPILFSLGLMNTSDVLNIIHMDQADAPENRLTKDSLPMLEGETRNFQHVLLCHTGLIVVGVALNIIGLQNEVRMYSNAGVFMAFDGAAAIATQPILTYMEELESLYRHQLAQDASTTVPLKLKVIKTLLKLLNLLFPLLEGALLSQRIPKPNQWWSLLLFGVGGTFSGTNSLYVRHIYQHHPSNTNRELTTTIDKIQTCLGRRWPTIVLNIAFYGGVIYWNTLMFKGDSEDQGVAIAATSGLVGGYVAGTLIDKTITPSRDPFLLTLPFVNRTINLRPLLNSLDFHKGFPIWVTMILLIVTSEFTIDDDDVHKQAIWDNIYDYILTAWIALGISVGLNLASSEDVKIPKVERTPMLPNSQGALTASLYLRGANS
jgi:hypothetical protein